MNEKPTLLLVDDEERILRSLAMLFRPTHRLLTTTDGREALEMVRRERVHVIVSDQRMPIMNGAELLRQVREQSPNTMRLLLTGYSDLAAVVASVNEGEIFRFINKPWDATDLRDTVAEATRIAIGLFGAETLPARVASDASGERILVIDDDPLSPRAVQNIAGAHHPVDWARSLDQAMAALEANRIALIVSELVVGGESIAPLLKMLKAEHPEIVTMVMTPFTDISVLVDLINKGQVYRFLPKPIRVKLLDISVSGALDKHRALAVSQTWRAAHAVERPTPPADTSIGARVAGFLARLRGRGTAPAAAQRA